MQIKNILSVPAFIITFSLALMLITIIPTKKISSFFNSKSNQTAKKKISEFLQKDRELAYQMSEKIELVSRNKKIEAMKEFQQRRQQLDVSGLPLDFQNAWEKNLLNDVEWINFIQHLKAFNGDTIIKTKAQQQISEEKIVNGMELENEMLYIAQSYGVELDEFGNLAE